MKTRMGLAVLAASFSIRGAFAEVCDKVGGGTGRLAPLTLPDVLKEIVSSPWTYLLLAVLVLAWKTNGRWRGLILGLAALSLVLNGLLTWVLIDEYRAPHPVLQSALLEGCRSQIGDSADQLGLWLFTVILAWIGLKPSTEGGRSHGASQS